jgi:hypothetical protein
MAALSGVQAWAFTGLLGIKNPKKKAIKSANAILLVTVRAAVLFYRSGSRGLHP